MINILMIPTLLMWLLNVPNLYGFFMHKGYLFKMGKICIPSSYLRDLLVQAAHGGGFNDHFSENKTYEWLEEHFLVC